MTEAQKRANAKYNHSEKGKAAKRKYMREYSQTDEYKEYHTGCISYSFLLLYLHENENHKFL